MTDAVVVLEGLVDRQGVLLRRDAVSQGYDDKWLSRMTRSGELVRIRQGAYVPAGIWCATDARGQHLITVHAVQRQYGDHVAASHVSATLRYGGPDWGLPLSHVHLTGLTGIGDRVQAGVRHHRGVLRAADVSRKDGSWITAPTRTALDTATMLKRDPAVCVLDWFLHQGLTDPVMLQQGLETMRMWPGTLGNLPKVRLATGRSESVGETRSMLFFRDHDLPVPEQQFCVYRPDGRLAGIADFVWHRHRLLGEFDGLTKYLRLRRPGESIEQAVMREKAREDLLRELTDYSMIRLVWHDLAAPQATRARLLRALARQAA